MTCFRRCFGLISALLALVATPAAADNTKCTGTIATIPMSITIPGVWCLKSNLSLAQASGYAVKIARDGVTIDLGGFRLDGSAAGPGTLTYGIYGKNRRNITIRNGTVEGFYIGIYLYEIGANKSNGHLVERIRAIGNRYGGLSVHGARSIVRDNDVYNTGNSTKTAYAVGISVVGCHDSQVLGNTVHGVTETTGAWGISTNCPRVDVIGNKISNVRQADVQRGINMAGGGRATVTGNLIIDSDAGDDAIWAIGGLDVDCIDNIIDGFASQLNDCKFASGNLLP